MVVSPDVPPVSEPSGGRQAWIAVWVLFTLYVLSLLDRGLFALMIEPIRLELHLSDSEIGLIKGIAFAITYTLVGLPVGWLVDRVPRRHVLSLATGTWSLSTFTFGLAQGFSTLFASRAALGAGESALTPAAHSLIGDLFPKNKLTLPLSVFSAAAIVGAGLSYVAGGAIYTLLPAESHVPLFGDLTRWRATFLLCGLVGVALIPFAYLFAEPPRRKSGQGGSALANETLFAFLARRRSFLFSHFAAFSIISIMNNALSSWIPTYLIRSFQWSIGEVGGVMGVMLTGFGIAGYIIAVRAVAWLSARGRGDAHFVYYAAASIACPLLALVAFRMSDAWAFLVVINLAQMVATYPVAGIAAASLQMATPAALRGRMAALFLLVFALVGQGIGPLAVGVLTDSLFHDRLRLGDSMLLVLLVSGPIAAFLFLRGRASMSEVSAER